MKMKKIEKLNDEYLVRLVEMSKYNEQEMK